ncbi:sigma-54-dependent transcriptional regulator [Aliidiomarina soli]|uniref:Sigma-54-dependent Fis family transcriptional regulator n=1 Tax=Aliidiomarina soli TaxID=1928574 RepID=A0A432WEP2_9GAMM|nr:sigma-54 dependent transcriptional regulator [Aliidiomarina soli]RUO31278.1 sigma-54-dependent Fis family transcriptional regulator [Aliidiomarina soli]
MTDDRQILIVEDDKNLQEAIVDTLELEGFNCVTADSAEQALLTLKDEAIDMVISDVQMPGLSGLQLLQSMQSQGLVIPTLMMTAYAKVDDAVIAMRAGALDYLSKPFSTERLLELVSRYLPPRSTTKGQPVVGDSYSEQMLKLAKRVANTDATVMITGPSGSGKEVLSQYIHQQSARSEGPFIAINCAAIPENMLEATLFGYEKGAFTGAVQAMPGKFEQAQGGTLLLDEITEMDLALQSKLLRVLQERQVERLGGRKTIELNVRIIATSNRDLKAAVADGVFREDLYYRLNVFPLSWRPLQDRAGDIIPLAEHLLSRHCERAGQIAPVLTDCARRKMQNYSWPGNVRELENVIQRALILFTDGEIKADDLLLDDSYADEAPTATSEVQERAAQSGLTADSLADPVDRATPERLGSELKQQEQQIILDALNRCNGKRKDVAEQLGISARTLRYKLAQMRDQGIDLP